MAADFLLIWCHAPGPNNRYLRWSRLWLCALEEADAGWDRQRRRNSVTSVVTLADCICQGCWPCVTAGSLCAITGLLDNTSEPLPATAGARLEQCPLKGTCYSSQERLTGVPASDAAPLPHSKQVLGTPRSRIKPSLCTSPAGSLAQSKPYNNKLGCESETKNNSVRKQISGSGCQGVITLNNRQSIISTVMRDVLTVSFQNGKQADGFRIKNTGTERKKEGASKKLHKKLRPCGRTVGVPMPTALGRAISFRASTTAGVTSQKTAQVTASPRTVSPLGHQPRGREIDTSPLPPGSRQSRGNNARLRKSECPQRCAGPWLSW